MEGIDRTTHTWWNGSTDENGCPISAIHAQMIDRYNLEGLLYPKRSDLITLRLHSPHVEAWMNKVEQENMPLEQSLIGMVKSLVRVNQDLSDSLTHYMAKSVVPPQLLNGEKGTFANIGKEDE